MDAVSRGLEHTSLVKLSSVAAVLGLKTHGAILLRKVGTGLRRIFYLEVYCISLH